MARSYTPPVPDEGRQPRAPQATLHELVNSVVGNQALNKRPLLIADDLEEQLLRQGWPTGLRVGGEPDLAHRYGVGRDVFREVVRLLEARDHAKMRRGPLGGLEIVRPELPELIARLTGYAYVTELDRSNILETWVLLQGVAIRVIALQDGRDWRKLAKSLSKTHAQGSRGLGQALIAASGSQLLGILGDLVAALLPEFVDAPLPTEVEAALAGADGAEGLLHALRTVALPFLLSELEHAPLDQRIGPPGTPQSSCFKGQAMQLVHDLMSATSPACWGRGQLIGNEFDLADRFGVDKSVVRQAIRLMEDAETATSLPGRGRGLMTRLPSTGPISRLLGTYFMAHGVDIADAEAIFDALSLERAGAAADRATGEDKASLLAMIHDLEGLAAPLPVAALQCFERLQQHAAHNCLLGLCIDAVKTFLTWRLASGAMASAPIVAAYRDHTKRVAAAICSGNRQKAITAEAEKLAALSGSLAAAAPTLSAAS